MDVNTIFTKTAKGLTQVNQRTQSLSRDLTKVLKAIDGKSTLAQLAQKTDIDVASIDRALIELKKAGFTKIFEVRKEDPLSDFGGDDDFDFTKPAPMSASLLTPVMTFGPSKFRASGMGETVEHAAAAPLAVSEPSRSAPAAAEAPAYDAEEEAKLQAALAATRAKSQAEARARAEREAQIRARLEVETKARKSAEEKAITEARRARVESERARLDLEARLAAEQENRKSNAAATEKLTVEQSARQEAEQQALSQARAEAQAEAKSLAEARARAETEAKALVVARQRAEAAAVRQQEELDAAQRNLRQELKAEIEAKLRIEMEALLRSDIEDTAREEVEAAIIQEAQDEARRMLEEQLIHEREMLARAEQDAKARAEIEAKRMLADQEKRLRAEMESRIAQIAAERDRAASEARAMADAQMAAAAEEAALLSQQLRAEAEARVAMASQMRTQLAHEQEALHQAQAQLAIESQLRERSERENQVSLGAERAAREAAEQKAKMETKARELASRAVANQVAEKQRITEEAEVRIAEERRARERAEEKAYADERAEERQRAAQVARLKELSEQAEQSRADETDAPKVKRRDTKSESHPIRWLVVGLSLFVVVAVALVQLVPLGPVNTRFEKALAAWMNESVSSKGINLVVFPKPHVRLDSLAFGKNFDANVTSGRLYTDVTRLFGDRFVIQTMELTGITVSAEALPRLLTWAKPPSRGKELEIDSVILKGVKLEVRGVALDSFDANLKFDRAGAIVFAEARANDGSWQFTAKKSAAPKMAAEEKPAPTETPPSSGASTPTPTPAATPTAAIVATAEPTSPAFDIEFTAKKLTMPLGAKIVLASLTAKGTWIDGEMVFPEVEGTVFDGAINGNLKVNLTAGVQFTSDFTLSRTKLESLFEPLTRDASVSGRMDGKFSAQGGAPTLAALANSVKLQGSFSARDGVIGNADLVQAMRSPGSVGGQSKFSELTGKMSVGDGQLRYEALKLTGGVLYASGGMTVNLANGTLNGSVLAELRSNVAQDRASFSLTGTVARPSLKRGG